MPLATNVPGWERLTAGEARDLGIKPSARPYIDPSGNVRTYNSFLNAQAQASGFANREQFLKWQKDPEHAALLKHFRAQAVKNGRAGTLQLGSRTLGDLRDAFYRPDGSKRPDDPQSRRSGGRLARFPRGHRRTTARGIL